VATFAFFHAHPDDESIGTGGTMARAAAEGHRTVLVVATRGELGEVDDGFLDEGEPLGARREQETLASAAILGVSRVEFLGYCDSGMVGLDTNDAPGCFWQADLDEAAARLAAILTDEQADVLTIYDDNGGYGHPDHVNVHRVGMRAAEVASTPHVFQGTMNRDAVRRSVQAAVERGEMRLEDGPPDDGSFGKPEAEITHRVDVTAFVGAKQASMRAHASQISEESFFLQMPDDRFAEVFGVEWYIECGAPRAEGEPVKTWLL
jgi:LmbE family N-acetylglucosaminyl deacetylase